MEEEKKGITAKKSENFSEWYTQVLIKSEFIDYSDVSGAIIFRPDAYAVWERIVGAVDSEFKKAGIDNVYFPLFIPEHFLAKEQEHLEGFVPEVAWVTETGSSKLSERLAVRPTSETIIYPSFSKWIRSWRDLPIRYNLWNNVVRWEFKNPTPFIRSREFLWNEGHSAYATEKEARAERDIILGIYQKALKEYLALPGIVGKKTDKEKFAGAVESYSIEHIMPDGWAIQGPDWHFDGQNFAKAFGISYLDRNGKKEFVWQNTYAISTREIGVMIATHGDDKGLIIPPRIARIQIVIVPIFKSDNAEKVLEYARKVESILKESFRVKLDDREGYTPGYKFNDWELKGVPIRLEIGPKEVDGKEVVIARRDTGAKTATSISDITQKIDLVLNEIHNKLYENALNFMRAHMHKASSYSEMKKLLKAQKPGIVQAPWCGSRECEDKIKEETSAKITNLPFEENGSMQKGMKCIYCDKPAKYIANFARSY
ncbi:MAG: proline--tRNA ligase [Candidatus Micrarchaeaceae archaeon]